VLALYRLNGNSKSMVKRLDREGTTVLLSLNPQQLALSNGIALAAVSQNTMKYKFLRTMMEPATNQSGS